MQNKKKFWFCFGFAQNENKTQNRAGQTAIILAVALVRCRLAFAVVALGALVRVTVGIGKRTGVLEGKPRADAFIRAVDAIFIAIADFASLNACVVVAALQITQFHL